MLDGLTDSDDEEIAEAAEEAIAMAFVDEDSDDDEDDWINQVRLREFANVYRPRGQAPRRVSRPRESTNGSPCPRIRPGQCAATGQHARVRAPRVIVRGRRRLRRRPLRE